MGKMNIVYLWANYFNTKNLNGILSTYSPNGVLLATFNRDILQGRNSIRPYFVDLFKKENLRVVFEPNPIITYLEEGYIVSGNYTFSFSENGITTNVEARYSYGVEIRGKNSFIVNHHSSERPK